MLVVDWLILALLIVWFIRDQKFYRKSWFGNLNYFFLQFLFIRLQKTMDKETGDNVSWSIIGWLLPCTGWSTDYVWLGKEWEIKFMSKKKILCDFDGTLHKYETKFSHECTISDGPIDGAIQFVKDLLDNDFEVIIFSSRGKHPKFPDAANDWFRKHGLDSKYVNMLKYSHTKDAHDIIFDDRAWNFSGQYPDMQSLKVFKPWNKRGKLK